MRKSGEEGSASASIPNLERYFAFLLKLRMTHGVKSATRLLEESLPSDEKRPCKSTDKSVSERSHTWSDT